MGAAIILALLIMAAFAETIAPYAYDQQIPGARLRPPGGANLLGTDNVSRDVFSRIVYGARVSVTVGFLTVLLGTSLASAIGITSGYFRGKYDVVVQRLVDAWQSFPYLIIILSLLAVLVARGLSVRETERLVADRRGAGTSANGVQRAEGLPDPDVQHMEGRMRDALGTKVTITPGRRGGRITIAWYDHDDLGRLVERLSGA